RGREVERRREHRRSRSSPSTGGTQEALVPRQERLTLPPVLDHLDPGILPEDRLKLRDEARMSPGYHEEPGGAGGRLAPDRREDRAAPLGVEVHAVSPARATRARSIQATAVGAAAGLSTREVIGMPPSRPMMAATRRRR